MALVVPTFPMSFILLLSMTCCFLVYNPSILMTSFSLQNYFIFHKDHGSIRMNFLPRP